MYVCVHTILLAPLHASLGLSYMQAGSAVRNDQPDAIIMIHYSPTNYVSACQPPVSIISLRARRVRCAPPASPPCESSKVGFNLLY
jgi:hypothetical protein